MQARKGKTHRKRIRCKQSRLGSRERTASHGSHADASRLLDGERVDLSFDAPTEDCQRCGGTRMRRRRVDVSILGGRLAIPGVPALYCADCGTMFMERGSGEAIADTIGIVRDLDREGLEAELRRGLDLHARERSRRSDGRRIVTVYFPGLSKRHRAAKISIRPTDPLLAVLEGMGSEDIRRTLGLESYEDLEREARAAHRTISRYLHVALGDKLL